MTKFKQKNSRKIVISSNNTTTLDGKHQEMLDNIRKTKETVMPRLIAERNTLKRELSKDKRILVEDNLDIQDRINEINTQLREIKRTEKNYLLDNSSLIFDYFENKKEVTEGKNKTTLLENFFNIDKIKNIEIAKERSNVHKFLMNVDDSFIDVGNYVVQTDICKSCYKGEMIPIPHEGQIVCNNCSSTLQYVIENEKPSYKEPPKEVCFYAYKRINHFREVIAQFQAKETTQIPDEVMEHVKQQIKKERIGLHQITNKRAKDILKKLGYNKYYEHIPFIKDKLGIRPPVMSHDLEETLCNLFMEIQGPYSKYCPDHRVNFLNYYYTVYKLCELLGQNEFLPFFPMLKDREKRIEQDDIWKKICEELNWVFVPTV